MDALIDLLGLPISVLFASGGVIAAIIGLAAAYVAIEEACRWIFRWK